MNITMLRDTLKCPQYATNIHIKRKGPLHTPTALEVGTLFHEGMEKRMVGERVLPYELPAWGDVSQTSRDVFTKHKLWIPLNGFEPDPNWEIQGIEMKVERTITQNLTLEGTLDGFIIWQGKLWDTQWKTYTDDLLELIEKVRLSWHEVGYQWMAEKNDTMLPWGGTILGACRKLPGYRMIENAEGKRKREEVTDEVREKAFTLHFITRPRAMQEDMVNQLLQTAMKAQRELEGGYILRNYDNCFNKWGGRCPFFKVCHEGENINGPEFRDLEDRYAKRNQAA